MDKTIVVRRIEPQTESRRTVLYGDDPSYKVIADLPSPNIHVGDVVEYEPYGVNFGFYVRTLSPAIVCAHSISGTPIRLKHKHERHYCYSVFPPTPNCMCSCDPMEVSHSYFQWIKHRSTALVRVN